MNEDTKLIAAVLKLPIEARAALAARLIESLDGEVDEDAEAQWLEEVERRVEDVDSGRVATVPWSEVRASIRRE